MIVDSGSSCSMVGCLLLEFLKQNKMKCTSWKTSMKVYYYGHSVPLRTAGCFTANVKLGNVTVELGGIYSNRRRKPGIAGKRNGIKLGVLALSGESVSTL